MRKLISVALLLGAGPLFAAPRPFRAFDTGGQKLSELVKRSKTVDDDQRIDYIFGLFRSTLEDAGRPLVYDTHHAFISFQYSFGEFQRNFEIDDEDFVEFLAVFCMIYAPKLPPNVFFKPWLSFDQELSSEDSWPRHVVSLRVTIWQPISLNPLRREPVRLCAPASVIPIYGKTFENHMTDFRAGWWPRVEMFLLRCGVKKDDTLAAVLAKMREMPWYMDGLYAQLVGDGKAQTLVPTLDFSPNVYDRITLSTSATWEEYLDRPTP